MDLIYTNTAHEDAGVLKDYRLDLAFGSDENDFELTLDANDHCCGTNCLVYIEGTEYGGIIDAINIVTGEDKLTYKGRTWHGILASKVIEPDLGASHLIVSGEVNMVIRDILDRIGLSDLFTTLEVDSGMRVDEYQFDRYIDAYSGINKMLATVSGKLKFAFTTDKVIISALPIVDYSQDEQFSNDNVEMEIEKRDNTVNHLICLGKGELAQREVIHLYRDASGNISEKQAYFGLQEITAVFDYPNAESTTELMKDGTEKLLEYASENSLRMDFAPEEATFDVGDIVGAMELITETFATEKITKKIVTIEHGSVNIQYKVGE